MTLIKKAALLSPYCPQCRMKNVFNENAHTLSLSLPPLLLPEREEESKGRSFHSALTVVILKETGREKGGGVGGKW